MTLRKLTTLLLLIAAALAAGCGADEETKPSIPGDSAQALQARLAEVQRRFDVGGGACGDISGDSQPAVETILASLPSSVDRDVRSALNQSFDRLFELTSEQCDDQEQTTTPTEAETTETTATTETTDTTETETTDTSDTDTQPTETVPPPDTTPTTPGDEDQDGGDNGGGASPGPGL